MPTAKILGTIYLTPHHTKDSEMAVSDPSGDEAGVPEIEITPAMIEAGIAALYRFNISEPTRPEMDRAIEATFRAMHLARYGYFPSA